MFGNIFKKKSKDQNPVINLAENTNKTPPKPSQVMVDHLKKKSELLGGNTLTREELIKQIEKEVGIRSGSKSNPFETKEDVIFVFFSSNMGSSKDVPFEEVLIGGKTFYVNKKFEAGKIIIEQVFASPDIEINLKHEYENQKTTRAQLNKINKYILHIKDQIAKGDDDYKLLDIVDLYAEKYRLESILESIKYGKSAIFKWEHPIKKKPMFALRLNNGQYRYLKVTENNFVTEENNIRFLKGYNIQKKLEDIANLRISKNLRDILIAIATILIIMAVCIILFKAMTFEETLFDERVKNFCEEQKNFYEGLLTTASNYKCSVPIQQTANPAYDEVR